MHIGPTAKQFCCCFRSEMKEKSRLYDEAAAADMTLLLGGYKQNLTSSQQHSRVFTGVSFLHDDEQVFESVHHSVLDPVNRSPDSCFADYYSQTDPDLSD